MEQRALGRTGLTAGVIGLGTEHIDQTAEALDEILGLAVDAGTNYVDLLYLEQEYWDRIGALIRRYREQLLLAAHWSSGPCADLDFCRRTFASMLAQVGNDHIEVAMMTMIDDGERQGKAWREASREHLRGLQQQGHITAIGASAHDVAIALEAVEGGWLDVLMFPINVLGRDDPRSQALVRACEHNGVALVAMKPYHGGTLLSIDGQPTGITPARCLDYVFSLPVATAVPGPRNAAEWRATLAYLDASAEERDHRLLLDTLHDRLAGHCVYCHHCLPCPEGLEIGWLIWHLDQVEGAGLEQVRAWYAQYPAKASACLECGVCLERCPFGVDIIAKLRAAASLFEGA